LSFTLQQLLAFDAVATEGGFQSAAKRLNRSHPSVFAAVRNLEAQLGFRLMDRSGYRVALTVAGREFHARTRQFLDGMHALQEHADQLAIGEEPALAIVIGDLCPFADTLALFRTFGESCPRTRLDLHFETLGGPMERLLDGDADLAVHYVDPPDERIESIACGRIRLVPVVAPGFLRGPVSNAIRPDEMRDYVQCVLRDTARHSPRRDYHLVAGARQCTVGDQAMKKEVILQGMGWGHMPLPLVAEELRDGRLLSIAGRHLKPFEVPLAVMRRRDRAMGPVATRLWGYIAAKAQEPIAGRPPAPAVS
jgi:DNA-binding transcriptional LysR family regulator